MESAHNYEGRPCWLCIWLAYWTYPPVAGEVFVILVVMVQNTWDDGVSPHKGFSSVIPMPGDFRD